MLRHSSRKFGHAFGKLHEMYEKGSLADQQHAI